MYPHTTTLHLSQAASVAGFVSGHVGAEFRVSVALCALYRCFSPFLNIYTGPKLDANGFCQLYRGAACSKFIAGRSIYVTENDQQGRMEDRMKGACRACVCACV